MFFIDTYVHCALYRREELAKQVLQIVQSGGVKT